MWEPSSSKAGKLEEESECGSISNNNMTTEGSWALKSNYGHRDGGKHGSMLGFL